MKRYTIDATMGCNLYENWSVTNMKVIRHWCDRKEEENPEKIQGQGENIRELVNTRI